MHPYTAHICTLTFLIAGSAAPLWCMGHKQFLQECHTISHELSTFYDNLNAEQKFLKFTEYVHKDSLEIMTFILDLYPVHTTEFLVLKGPSQNTLAHVVLEKIMLPELSLPTVKEYITILKKMVTLENSLASEKNVTGISLIEYIGHLEKEVLQHIAAQEQAKRSFFYQKPTGSSLYNPFTRKNNHDNQESRIAETGLLTRKRSRSFIAGMNEQRSNERRSKEEISDQELSPLVPRKKSTSFPSFPILWNLLIHKK